MSKLVEHVFTPANYELLEAEALIQSLGLQETFYIQVLDFPSRVQLDEVFVKVSKRKEDKKISLTFNNDAESVAWIVSAGVVDSQGLPIFDKSDALKWSCKYELLAYDLAWQVIAANNFTDKSKQATVGNSEGTEQQETSSEQLVN